MVLTMPLPPLEPSFLRDALRNYNKVKTLSTSKEFIVISDLHGKLNLLEAVIEKFKDKTLIFIGDIMDRGPDSKACIEIVTKLIKSGKAYSIMGNHDIMSLSHIYNYCNLLNPANKPLDTLSLHYLESKLFEHTTSINHWLQHGGKQTLASFGDFEAALFGVEVNESWINLFHAYVEFLKHAYGSVALVNTRNQVLTVISHAAPPRYVYTEDDKIRHASPHATEDDNYLAAENTPLDYFNSGHLWDRPGVVLPVQLPMFACRSIHGHTIQQHPTKYVSDTTERLYIDVGSFRTNKICAYNTLINVCHVYDGDSETWDNDVKFLVYPERRLYV